MYYLCGVIKNIYKMKNLSKKVQALVLTQKGLVNKTLSNNLSHTSFDFDQGKIYTGYYRGSGRHTQRASVQSDVIALLKARGLKYSTGNDAPKGGASGEYVKCSKIGLQFIEEIKFMK